MNKGKNVVGKIHSVETLGTLDGPGIRFVIFMQGCPLKCKYCHNRDTWDARNGKKVTIDELINKIVRSKPYFDASGGGVTVSGGEPLLQPVFLTELFKRLHELNITTCLDTAGSVKITKEIKELLKYTDLVLLDIKHIDDKKCKDLVGQSNINNLDFARYLSDHEIPMWIRQVLVPEYTDDEEDLKKLKDFIQTLNSVEKVEILPYHDLGKAKWKELGLDYPLGKTKQPTEEQIKKAERILFDK